MKKMLEAILAYLSENGSNRKIAAAKGRITKFANELASEIGAAAAREKILKLLEDVTEESSRWDLLKNRFTPGSLYTEGDRVFGWWDTSAQVQAEELPLYGSGATYSVSFYRRDNEAWLWRQRGFELAEDLPTVRRGNELVVQFNVKRSLFWLKYGYALPCDLPWHRGRFDGDGNCLWVDRSIISAGWWQAWKWWDGAKWWYLEKRPELFADMDWWGDWEEKPVFYSPPDDPYAAVLGTPHR